MNDLEHSWDDALRDNLALSLSPFVKAWIKNHGLDHALYSLAILYQCLPDEYHRRVYGADLSFEEFVAEQKKGGTREAPIDLGLLAEELHKLAIILRGADENFRREPGYLNTSLPTPAAFRAWIEGQEIQRGSGGEPKPRKKTRKKKRGGRST
jgi:hypothetical protein